MGPEQWRMDVTSSLARIEEKVEGLAGPAGRVTALEKSQNRQWWFTVAIGPLLALLHAFARKSGIDL